ncbi:hypothetical protein [Chryseobacterium turcicum]|uniref:Uncharacterized protein n=1 Tax=Chryseobacterium turcicum TaxID=2898076 RepID=A0A9Q3UY41_9FLAO|nr:hypothetical protein [Chryseobacterium turcicum]MCD1116028.1 hypothetical protein [Chryseobacterium turcicum]
MIVLFRSFLFNFLFSYKIIDERQVLKLEQKMSGENSIVVEDIIHDELNKTSSLLRFTFDKCDSEPNELLKSKKANCIGYSAFLAASINNKLHSNSLNNEWKARHKVGEIYLLGYNIHPLFKSGFFKNHDFVVIENRKTNEVIAVDPALYDYFGINKIRLK